MLDKKEQYKQYNKQYYLKHREEIIERNKKYREERIKAYKEPDLEGEEWKPLIGFEEHYLASNMGRIKSIWRTKERVIGGCLDKDGYIKITLTHPDRSQSTLRRARLIAETWLPNPDNKPEIDHYNTVRADDRVENLRWVTSKENKKNALTIENRKKVDYGFNRGKHREYIDNKYRMVK